MKTIYKYQLEVDDEQVILMPKGAEVLSVQVQKDKPCIWAIVDTSEPCEEQRTFVIHGTGHPCEESASQFIGTFQMMKGSLVFHLFEKRK